MSTTRRSARSRKAPARFGEEEKTKESVPAPKRQKKEVNEGPALKAKKGKAKAVKEEEEVKAEEKEEKVEAESKVEGTKNSEASEATGKIVLQHCVS